MCHWTFVCVPEKYVDTSRQGVGTSFNFTRLLLLGYQSPNDGVWVY